MPEVNQIQNLLLGAGLPLDVRARMQAGQEAEQHAAAPSAPYTSRGAALAKALEGGLGGFMEGSAIHQAMDGQAQSRAQMLALADAIHGGAASSGAAPGGGASMPMPTAMPMGQGGVGSDAIASRTARNPGGYDPKATEALIRSRAPAFGIDPDAAVNVARHEGLNVYGGDKGSSFGPFQLHYGGVAAGGNAVGGMGDDFTKATGLDARDPSTVPQQVDFALSHAAKGGWGPWHGAQAAKMGNWDGIGKAPQGTATAAADIPAANAQPVASNTLPPGITPDMVSAPPKSDGSLRGDLMAAMNKQGAAPSSAVTSPSASSGTLAGGAGANQIDQPFDPEGTGPANYDPNAAPLMGTSGAALSNALQSFKPPLGQAQAAVVPPPVTASTPDAAPPPSILPPATPPSGLGTAGAPVVPAPQGSLASPPAPASDGSLRGDLIAAAQKQGLNVAMDPVVPDPQGSLVPPAPSSPNGMLAGPQSDAAMGNDAPLGVPANAPPAPPPALPDAAPLPPMGGQTPQVVADQDAAAAPEIDPEGTGPQNYDPNAGPSLRDTLTAAMNGGAATPPPAPAPIAPPAPAPAPQPGPGAGPAPAPAPTMPLPSADDPVGGLVGAPGAPASPGGPGAPPLPMMAGANVPPPTPMASAAPLPGTGAALPQTGPMPPSGGQTMGAGSSLPQTGPMPPPGAQSLALADALDGNKPAPSAVQAGPMPVSPALADALSSPRQPLGLPGDGGGDPSSPQAFMRQQALAAQLGGGSPQNTATPSGGMATPSPAPGGLIGSIGSMFGGGAGPAQGGAPAPSPVPAPAPMGGSGPAAASAASPSGGAPPSGNYAQARAVAAGILANPYAQPAAVEMASKVLFPQAQVVTGADGKTYAVNPQEGSARLLFDGGAKFDPNQSLMQGGHFTQAPDKPMDLAPDHTAVTFGANNQAIPQVRAAPEPSMAPIAGTGLVGDKSGNFRAVPGGVNGTTTVEAGGAKVPYATNTGPNGTTATPLINGGGAPGQPGQGGPLDAVKPIVEQANTMKAQGDAQADEAKTQVTDLGKTAQTGIAARQKLQTLNELQGLSQKFGNGLGARLGNWLHEHGVSTQTGSDQEAFNGLSTALAIDERPTGSGALRTAEIEGFKRQAGSPTQTPEDRLAAIGRLSNVFQRDAQAGDLASNSKLPADQRTAMVHQLYSLPYDKPVAVTPADAMKMAPGTQFRDLNGNLRVVPGAQQ